MNHDLHDDVIFPDFKAHLPPPKHGLLMLDAPLRMYVWTQDALRDGPITAVAVAHSVEAARALLLRQGVAPAYAARRPQSFPVDMPVAWIYGNRQ